jgi:hypothetical protein
MLSSRPGQRIPPLRVGPVLADQDLRPEPAQQRRDDRDRKKDLIIRGGYNIYPREIEEVLYEHPAVREAAVIGLPHPQLGGEVGATVVLNPGASVTAKELRDHVKKQVAAYMISSPAGISLVESTWVACYDWCLA